MTPDHVHLFVKLLINLLKNLKNKMSASSSYNENLSLLTKTLDKILVDLIYNSKILEISDLIKNIIRPSYLIEWKYNLHYIVLTKPVVDDDYKFNMINSLIKLGVPFSGFSSVQSDIDVLYNCNINKQRLFSFLLAVDFFNNRNCSNDLYDCAKYPSSEFFEFLIDVDQVTMNLTLDKRKVIINLLNKKKEEAFIEYKRLMSMNPDGQEIHPRTKALIEDLNMETNIYTRNLNTYLHHIGQQ
jgi:hypothetical protein